eukprot:scaffold117941_cov60-Attheya_sp.AAC.2
MCDHTVFCLCSIKHTRCNTKRVDKYVEFDQHDAGYLGVDDIVEATDRGQMMAIAMAMRRKRVVDVERCHTFSVTNRSVHSSQELMRQQHSSALLVCVRFYYPGISLSLFHVRRLLRTSEVLHTQIKDGNLSTFMRQVWTGRVGREQEIYLAHQITWE